MRMEVPFVLSSIALENFKARQSMPRGGSCCRARQLFMLGVPPPSREGIQMLGGGSCCVFFHVDLLLFGVRRT